MTSLSQRLRQKLLDLAIRGKLVPQDAHDEPASELLERIRNDELGMRNGRARRAATAVPISDDEQPFDLPKGWCWCRLGEIAYVATGKTPSKTDFVDDGVPYLKMYNLRKQKIDFAFKRQYVKREVHEGQLARSRLAPGDLLMNIVGPPLGKLAIIPESLPEANFNQAAVMIRAYREIATVNRYLFYYLSQMDEINSIDTKGTAGQDNISLTQAQRMRIALPPLAEQKRIVAALDGMLAAADAVASGTEKIAALKEKARAKILDLAIRGKLVKQDCNDEPVDALLKRIATEKAMLVAAKKIKKEKPLPMITEEEKPFDLPRGWAWARFADITHSNCLNDGDWILSDDMVDNGPVKLLQLGSVGDGKYINKGFKYLTEDRCEQLGCTEIHPGYLLINRMIGDKLLACILPNVQGRVITAVDVCWIAPSDNYCVEYLAYVVLSAYFQKVAKGLGAGDGRVRISKGNLVKIAFPLPPLAEQKRIVAKVDEMLAACDGLVGEV